MTQKSNRGPDRWETDKAQTRPFGEIGIRAKLKILYLNGVPVRFRQGPQKTPSKSEHVEQFRRNAGMRPGSIPGGGTKNGPGRFPGT